MLKRCEASAARLDELEKAASTISSESLEKAKRAIATDCSLCLRLADSILEKVDGVSSAFHLKKLAKALALCQLGYLPAKPIACPFCIQNGDDRTCQGCGYAKTHRGRCDQDSSAFHQFIEAFYELGAAIYQDNHDPFLDLEQGKAVIGKSAAASVGAAMQMLDSLPKASAFDLMEQKASYISHVVAILPMRLFAREVNWKQEKVMEKLLDYW